MEVREELQEAVVDSVLVDEEAVVVLEGSREEVREASHLEVGVVPVVDFLVDVVKSLALSLLLLWITRRYRFMRGCTCKGCFGNNKINGSSFLDVSVFT